ncbi:MAG TPA: SDR family NAD(P)-dependent oxidoreductase [Acidimicrobiales bacterium]|nr:SDR family NAD(P)-dependent oxidoreductase [Acidimicrobiales bacterium]
MRGSTVLVTGATSGIGRETALLLARRGAAVWATGRSGESLAELTGAHPSGAGPGSVTPVVADLSSETDRAALVEAVGPVDVLVNNAGIGWTGLVEEMPPAAVRQLFEVNVLALIDLTKLVLPGMLRHGHGHVVNVASVASWVAVPPLTVYSATKFAVQGFSEGLAREVAGRGVRVSTVNPGPVATLFWARATTEDRPSEDIDGGTMRGVSPALVARAVLRCIRLGRVPGYRTVAVPRAAGLARLGAVPGLRLVVDAGARTAQRTGATERGN